MGREVGRIWNIYSFVCFLKLAIYEYLTNQNINKIKVKNIIDNIFIITKGMIKYLSINLINNSYENIF